ncbi:MAG: DUF1127 domain-containing protein [Pseudolabrys sp.]
MSCGSNTCNPTNLPHDLAVDNGSAWPARVLTWLGAIFEKTRRQQLWFELEKARQRGLLKDLDDWQLKDLGLTREQAMREARKPFWK